MPLLYVFSRATQTPIMAAQAREGARKEGSMRFVTVALGVLVGLSTAAHAAGSSFDIHEERDFITLLEDGVPVLRYVRGEILAPGIPEDRRRSTYIHPLFSLDGTQISDDFPADHHHHRGMNWTWLKVSFDDVTKDLWTLRGIRQRYEGPFRADVSQSAAHLSVRSGWYEDSTGRKILDERVALAVQRSDARGRIMDFELTLSALDTPVSIGVSGRGYSGLGIRFAPREDTTITIPEGILAGDEDKIPHPWADFSARFAGKKSFDGVAILQHPGNPHFPDGWTLRQYGYLSPSFTNAAPDYTIRPGQPLTLRYRVFVHRGLAGRSELARLWRDYEKRSNQK